ncbi:hypothetical protein KKI22_02220 [Patescibacteria group bacterium]|nr:hypothetical protein [Patescibacteria group bacterium]
MKEIKLDCFASNELCINASSLENFVINEPRDQEFSLQIANHGNNDCELNLSAKNFSQNNSLSQVKLLISSQNELFFRNNLEQFFKQKIHLNSIEAQSSKIYYFYLDFLNLSISEEQFLLNFDLLLDFVCKESSKLEVLSNEIKQSEVEMQKSTQGAVLSASSSAEVKQNPPQVSLFFYLLSILFVIAFFVIIKFINGKKKKKQKKLLV